MKFVEQLISSGRFIFQYGWPLYLYSLNYREILTHAAMLILNVTYATKIFFAIK